MKFELDIKVLNGQVTSNAKELLPIVENGLKHYDYIVTENTYNQAKKDRTSLRSLKEKIKDERDRIFKPLEVEKEQIMALEKLIMNCDKKLKKGIDAIDDEQKLQKKKQIEELWTSISNDKYKFDLVFDEKYLNKSTNAKFIEDDLRKKFKIAEEHFNLMETFLPENDSQRGQVINVFMNTLDLSIAKSKADELKIFQEKVNQSSENRKQEQKVEDIEAKPIESHLESVKSNEVENRVQFITFKVNAPYDTLKAFNDVLGKFMDTHQDMKIEVLEKGE